MHSKCKILWITNQTICKICLLLKLHFEFNKKFAQKSNETWLFVSKVCIKEDIPREWSVVESKKTYNLQMFVESHNSVWFQRHLVKNLIAFTISISKTLVLGTDQVLPMRTISVCTRYYSTISTRSIFTATTRYPCGMEEIPSEKLLVQRGRRTPERSFCTTWNTFGAYGCPWQVAPKTLCMYLAKCSSIFRNSFFFLFVFGKSKITLRFDCQSLWTVNYTKV